MSVMGALFSDWPAGFGLQFGKYFGACNTNLNQPLNDYYR